VLPGLLRHWPWARSFSMASAVEWAGLSFGKSPAGSFGSCFYLLTGLSRPACASGGPADGADADFVPSPAGNYEAARQGWWPARCSGIRPSVIGCCCSFCFTPGRHIIDDAALRHDRDRQRRRWEAPWRLPWRQSRRVLLLLEAGRCLPGRTERSSDDRDLFQTGSSITQ